MIERIVEYLKDRRRRILEGEINCIPFNLPRFSNLVPGIEKGKYYLLSGATKAAKTQITNYLFVYTPILYCYKNPDKARIKIFYYALEETPDNITLRFISYLLYTLYGITIAPIDLKSTSENKVLTQDIIDKIESPEIQDILKFYEDHVIFMDSRNPTGMWKDLIKYAEATGTIHKKKVDITNKETGIVEQKEVFDYYEPKDEKEYVEIIADHVSLLEPERGFDLRQTINKYSEYMMILRNKYNYIPVCIQQQSTETTSLDAFKTNKIIPTMAGLSDSKYTAKDSSIMLGITSPYSYDIPTFYGYDITKLRDKFRLLTVVLNREGTSNDSIGLYFNGACNYFKELPRPTDKEAMEKVYNYMNTPKVFFMFSKIINSIKRLVE